MAKLTATHTYAELELSQAAYDEIASKLKEAGYDHVFMDDGTIDMQGIGVTREGVARSSAVTDRAAGLTDAHLEDLRSHIRGSQPSETGTYEYELGSGWRCFHCGEMFRTHGGAELHFGKPADKRPTCVSVGVPQGVPEQAANKPAIDPKQIKAIDDFLADGERDRGYRAFAMMRHLWPRLRELALGEEGSK